MKKIIPFIVYAAVILCYAGYVSADADCTEKYDSLKVKIVDVKIDTSQYQRLLGKGESVSMRSGRIILRKGEKVGEHSTDNYEEFVIVLVGEGLAENHKGEKIPIREGQVIYIPPYSKHNIHNVNSKMLMYIYVVAKAYDEEHEHNHEH
ncbi:MAG: cupin domain-containing protein [Ignavibacteria bacterium]|nr:cupin domain-containing protein [Ignavibacteria bacterium]